MPKKRTHNAGLGNKKPKKKTKSAPSPQPNAARVLLEEQANDYEETREEEDNDRDDESLEEPIALAEDHRLKETKNRLFEQVELSQRMAISYMFVNGLGMQRKEETWKGRVGVISQIQIALGIKRKTTVKDVLQSVIACYDSNKPYTGEREYCKKKGRRPLITENSVFAQIVADCLKDGKSLSQILNAVNAHCEEANLPTFNMNPIRSAVKVMKPRLAYDDWCKANDEVFNEGGYEYFRETFSAHAVADATAKRLGRDLAMFKNKAPTPPPQNISSQKPAASNVDGDSALDGIQL